MSQRNCWTGPKCKTMHIEKKVLQIKITAFQNSVTINYTTKQWSCSRGTQAEQNGNFKLALDMTHRPCFTTASWRCQGWLVQGWFWDGHGWSGSIGFLQEPPHAHPKKVLNVNPSLQTSPTSHCHSSIIPETGKINTIMTLQSTTMNTFIMAVIALDGRPLSSVIRLSSV